MFPKYIGTIYFGEYGWDEETYRSVEDKLSYVITMIRELEVKSSDEEAQWQEFLACDKFRWLKELVYGHCGQELMVSRTKNVYYSLGYIDHQSLDVLDDFWSNDAMVFKAKMKEFIFNSKYGFETGNDNN